MEWAARIARRGQRIGIVALALTLGLLGIGHDVLGPTPALAHDACDTRPESRPVVIQRTAPFRLLNRDGGVAPPVILAGEVVSLESEGWFLSELRVAVPEVTLELTDDQGRPAPVGPAGGSTSPIAPDGRLRLTVKLPETLPPGTYRLRLIADARPCAVSATHRHTTDFRYQITSEAVPLTVARLQLWLANGETPWNTFASATLNIALWAAVEGPRQPTEIQLAQGDVVRAKGAFFSPGSAADEPGQELWLARLPLSGVASWPAAPIVVRVHFADGGDVTRVLADPLRERTHRWRLTVAGAPNLEGSPARLDVVAPDETTLVGTLTVRDQRLPFLATVDGATVRWTVRRGKLTAAGTGRLDGDRLVLEGPLTVSAESSGDLRLTAPVTLTGERAR